MRLFLGMSVATSLALAADPTFHKDILPILQKSCQSCHRPGEIGPMPLLTYEQARPWAKAIKQAVVTRRMPPWHSDRTVGTFHNDPSLPQATIDTIAAWADAGAPAGNPADAPAPRTFTPGWNIGTPDLIVEMPKPYTVPASGTIEYTYVIVPTGFKEDRWISSSEYRPGNSSVVHHATVFIRTPESRWLRKYPVGEFFVPDEQIPNASTPRPAATTNAGAGPLDTRVSGYVPGLPEKHLTEGYGRLIPAGSDIVFQLHYTANGKTATTDLSKVGFIFSKTKPAKRVITLGVVNDGFAIPAGAANHPVSGTGVLNVDAELLDVEPHMHLRGKSMNLAIEFPDGRREEVLRVPNYDFNWQHLYTLEKPKQLPRGTILAADGAFDNSANNRFNPDPKIEVRWGDQSWQEMMVGFFTVAVAPDTDVRRIFTLR